MTKEPVYKENRNPFRYLDLMFKGVIPEDYTDFNPYLICKYIADNDYFLLIADLLNSYTFNLPREIMYKLLVNFLKGEKTFINYIKKSKDNENKDLEEAKTRIKDFYHWSDRELQMNFFTLKEKTDFESLLRKLAFTEKEIKNINKVKVKTS